MNELPKQYRHIATLLCLYNKEMDAFIFSCEGKKATVQYATEEQIAALFRHAKVKDEMTEPRSVRGKTYLEMVRAVKDGSDKHNYLWSTDIQTFFDGCKKLSRAGMPSPANAIMGDKMNEAIVNLDAFRYIAYVRIHISGYNECDAVRETNITRLPEPKGQSDFYVAFSSQALLQKYVSFFKIEAREFAPAGNEYVNFQKSTNFIQRSKPTRSNPSGYCFHQGGTGRYIDLIVKDNHLFFENINGGSYMRRSLNCNYNCDYGRPRFTEASTLPAIAKVAGVISNPRITSVMRQDTIFNTVQAMGVPVKVNAMNNVVAEVPDMKVAGTVLQTIYQQFGVKGSFMVTWEGKGKLYWDPRTPVDRAVAISYANSVGLPPPSSRGYLA